MYCVCSPGSCTGPTIVKRPADAWAGKPPNVIQPPVEATSW